MIQEEQKELFRKRDGYSVFFVPYSASETGVKVESCGELDGSALRRDLKEAVAKRQRVSFPREQLLGSGK